MTDSNSNQTPQYNPIIYCIDYKSEKKGQSTLTPPNLKVNESIPKGVCVIFNNFSPVAININFTTTELFAGQTSTTITIAAWSSSAPRIVNVTTGLFTYKIDDDTTLASGQIDVESVPPGDVLK